MAFYSKPGFVTFHLYGSTNYIGDDQNHLLCWRENHLLC